MFVPRRNIETWLAYLERDCDAHANRLYAMCHEVQ